MNDNFIERTNLTNNNIDSSLSNNHLYGSYSRLNKSPKIPRFVKGKPSFCDEYELMDDSHIPPHRVFKAKGKITKFIRPMGAVCDEEGW